MYHYLMELWIYLFQNAYGINIEIENQAYRYIIWKMLAIPSAQ
jgi:hypothetical protein